MSPIRKLRGPSKRTVLIIDEPNPHSLALAETLSAKFRVVSVSDGDSGLQIAAKEAPDLIMLDVRLPRKNGILICSALRENGKTRDIPIIMMTGFDNQEARTMAYRAGADDYLSKPFVIDEAMARVESKIRRIEERSASRRVLSIGDIVIDRDRMSVSINGRGVLLSTLEYRLLEYFVENRERVLSRDQILADIWRGTVVAERTIDTHVMFLRRKLSTSGYAIRTLYAAGYIFEPRNSRGAIGRMEVKE